MIPIFVKIFNFKEKLLKNAQLIIINFKLKINNLNEVIVKKSANMAKALSLPNADKKPLTKIENKLNYHNKPSVPILLLLQKKYDSQ